MGLKVLGVAVATFSEPHATRTTDANNVANTSTLIRLRVDNSITPSAELPQGWLYAHEREIKSPPPSQLSGRSVDRPPAVTVIRQFVKAITG